MEQVFEIDLLGPVINFDAIKISGALVSAYSEIFGYNETQVLLQSDDFDLKVTDPFPLYKDSLLFPISNLSFEMDSENSFNAKRNAMLKRKKIPKLATHDTLKKVYDSLKSGTLTIGKMEEITADIDFTHRVLGLSDVEIPGLNISGYDEERTIYTKQASIVKEGSLWIGIKSTSNDFSSCLSYLQQRGVSGRLSSGFGQFRVKGLKQILHEGYEGEGLYLNLMPFIPTEESIKNMILDKSLFTVSTFSGTDRNGKDLGIYSYISSGSVIYLKGAVKGEIIHFPLHGGKPNRILNFSGYMLKV